MAKSFGVVSTGGYGVLQSVSYNGTAEIAQCRDADGKVTDEKAYSARKEYTAEFVFDGDTLADPGTALALAGETALITNVGFTESNTDYKRGTVTIAKTDGATQVGYS